MSEISRRFIKFFAHVDPENDDEELIIPLGKEILALAGIELEDAEGPEALYSDRASIDLLGPKLTFSIEVSGLLALGDETSWYKDLEIDPKGPHRQCVNFRLRADRIESGELAFDIVSADRNRWLRRIVFPFTVVE